MPEQFPAPLALERDGTGQSGRSLPALDPASAALDERGPADGLAFADAFARTLAYRGLDGRVDGDWQGLLNPAGLDPSDLPALWRDIEAFLAGPDAYDDASPHRRPHLVLLLAFLRLLGLSQARLNRLTREHLDFYYRQVLGLAPRPGRPDRVHLIARIAAGVDQALLPAGTWLEAGKDGQGRTLRYRTDTDLTVNRARVKNLRSVFVDKRVVGLREAREASEIDQADPLLAMAALVYGDPANHDALPAYPATGQVPDAPLLDRLDRLLAFVGGGSLGGLYLDFQEFRSLVRLKDRRLQTARTDWVFINTALQSIGKAVANNPAFAIAPPDSSEFWANLKRALGNQAPDFASLPEGLRSLEDIYWRRDTQDAKNFIVNKLRLGLEQFAAMMAKKMEIDQDWRVVNGLLEAAGQRRRGDASYRLLADSPDNPYGRASTAFAQNFQKALADLDYAPVKGLLDPEAGTTDLDRFAAALWQVEAYFHCPLEDFDLLARARRTDSKPPPAEWERAYAILAAAYTRKVYADRRAQLDALWRERVKDGLDPAGLRKAQKAALEAMARLATGERSRPAAELPDLLARVWPQSGEGSQVFAKLAALLLSEQAPPLTQAEPREASAGLELAWRNREGRPPVAQREEWLGIHAAADATLVRSADGADTPRWRTFGQRRGIPATDPAPPLGWALASPLLGLGQGERSVVLTLVFQPDNYNAKDIAALLAREERPQPAFPPFQVGISGGKDWVAPDTLQCESIDYPLPNTGKLYKALRLTLGFKASAPALAAPADGTSPWPLLRLLPRQDGGMAAPYVLFQALALERVSLKVGVVGLADLLLANDEGALVAGRPFEPFGLSPAAGSALLFTHPELAGKRLDSLSLNLSWMKLPAADLGGHYKNYPAWTSAPANTVFTAKLSLVDHRLAVPLLDKTALFDAKDANTPRKLGPCNVPARLPGDYAAPGPDGPASWPRYFRLELNSPDFQHGSYAPAAAAKAVALALAIAGEGTSNAADYQVNPPYTPKLKSFSVDYQGSVEIALDPADPLAYGLGEERIYHWQVFGHSEIQPEPDTGLYRFLPSHGFEGELYIGLEGVAAPQDISLLFQLAEGSADPDLEPPPVAWSYLSGNQWHDLGGGLLADGTSGLIQSGIVRFRLPPAAPGTLLPPELYWLRAAVARAADGLCDSIDILAQAVAATRADAPEGAAQPLPPHSLRKPATPVPGIAAIEQPYSSFGGAADEAGAAFDLRVSERLRHKQRAVALWDYERLVLERFPAIYKAKCIPAAATDPTGLGRVELVVVPNIQGRFPFDPFAPKATAGQLAEIAAFLRGRMPPLADLRVKNAHYVPVRTRFAVRFLPGRDPGYYRPLLNEELNRFLSPWAYAEGSDVTIGGGIYANAIIDFLERRPYVDYVAELKLFKDEDGLGFRRVPDEGGGYRVRADRPDAVLVADRRHEIDLIAEAGFADADFTGIGYMKIELDFIVN